MGFGLNLFSWGDRGSMGLMVMKACWWWVMGFAFVGGVLCWVYIM